MPLSLKARNKEIAGIGANVERVKGVDSFLFRGGESDDWIDRTVPVSTINSRTLEQWIDEYRRLKKLNQQMMKSAKERSKHVRRPRRPGSWNGSQRGAAESPQRA